MKFKTVLEVLAGHASIAAILVLVLLLSIAGAPLLQQKEVIAKRIGADVAISKAHAVSEALLANPDPRVLDSSQPSFTATHFPRALNGALDTDHAQRIANDAFAAEALEHLRSDATQPQRRFVVIDDQYHLRYATADGAGGMLMLDLPLDRERAVVGRFFGQSYLSGNALGFLLVVLLLIGSFGLRHYLRGLMALPDPERRGVIEEALRDRDPNLRRNRLPWMVALCISIFLFDLTNTMDSAVGIGYVLAVTLCLRSNRSWHITVVALFGAVLMFLAPILSEYDTHWWAYLERHSASLFAILVTGMYGNAHMRKSRAEALALAEATRSRHETEALRVALQRAETAEAGRRDTADRLALANRAAGISMWHWDTRTDAVTVSDDSPLVARVGSAHFSGLQYMREFVHPDDQAAYAQVFKDALALQPSGLINIDHRYRVQLPNGEIRHVQFHGRVLHDESGKAVSILGVDWEVTREEEAVQEIARQASQLREAQDRFQRAIRGTQDVLFEIDAKSSTCWFSPRFLELLDREGTDAPRTLAALHALVHPGDRERLIAITQAHFTRQEPFDVEYRLQRKDLDYIWVRSRATAQRDETGAPTLLSGSISDITEARAAREALIRATEEAEAASRAKSTFLATMSHEIRTPMNGVIGMTGLLLETQLDRVQRDYADTIRTSADSLLTILNDILDFSKIEAGKLDIEDIEFDLNTNVDDVASTLAFQAAAKGLELVVNVRPEVPERVFGDPQRIRQCLLNLVGNAIKFTNQGEVVIEVCSPGRCNGRSLVHFEIRDTGIGIPPEALGNLFNAFTQADSSTTRQFGGTGLGLSIVRRLVELMGGQVGAHSEPGKGSAFWFTLPLEPALSAAPEQRLLVTSKNKRVLLVDDNETNRRVLAGQVANSGYSVSVAASADEAMQLLRNAGAEPFDIVVLDYHMPDVDGAMLGERIVEDKSIAPVRLVLLTSLDRSGDVQRFANIGFAAYLTKPVRTRELLECLEQSLSHDARDWHLRSQPIITRGTLIAGEARRRYSGKVLLVEDNAINQRVARRFLERLGCEVRVVNDGQQAVDACRDETWAFILMDMQMPVMDGLEATRRIRELEGSGPRTPIVALTANAMMGQLERCLEAGMNDYLTKPLDIARLEDVLDRFLSPAASEKEKIVTARPSHSSTAMSIRNRLNEIADGDAEFAVELLSTFIAGAQEALQEMELALHANDLSALGRAAHKLKGASSNLHIEELATRALAIETRAKANEVADWHHELAQLSDQFARISMTLRELMEESGWRDAQSA